MRFIIYGAGGVGCVVGAQLSKTVCDVVLIARGPHLDALKTRGLRYQTPSEDVTLRIPVLGHPSEITFQDDDVVILTMKAQHTEAALEDLRAACGDGIAVVCCQNGVANERMALRRFRHVHGMCVNMPAQFIEPGCVQSHAAPRPGVLDLGLYPGGTNALSTEIASRLEQAGFSSRPHPDVMRAKYAKLLTNLANGLKAIAAPEGSADDLLAMLKDEGRACFTAAGIDWADEDEVRRRTDGIYEHTAIDGAKRVGGSTRQSLIRGTGDIEVDYLNGEVVLLGRLHGVATPANAVIQRLANARSLSSNPADTIALDEIRRLIVEEAGTMSGG